MRPETRQYYMIAPQNVSDPTMQVGQSPSSIVDPPPLLFPRPPLWVDETLGTATRRLEHEGQVDIVDSCRLALLTTTVTGARSMSADVLRAGVSDAYAAIGRALTAIERLPIRFWNFIPYPGDPMGAGLDRYMVFNAGRFAGYTQWLGASKEFGRVLPTASAVGVVSDDLVIHCLASDERGTPVDNPRQTPAWRYSRRYGPIPPCFSRATIANVNGTRLLLVGGTASIVGEDSIHEGNVDAQLDETLRNLEALIDAAARRPTTGSALGRLLDVRVYVALPENAAAIRETVTARCARAARVELAIARVCRPELLLEIEGVAEL
jgi:chorismate lyase/3-hydroxybenzoate synthase